MHFPMRKVGETKYFGSDDEELHMSHDAAPNAFIQAFRVEHAPSSQSILCSIVVVISFCLVYGLRFVTPYVFPHTTCPLSYVHILPSGEWSSEI
jgi:hypothetical protein